MTTKKASSKSTAANSKAESKPKASSSKPKNVDDKELTAVDTAEAFDGAPTATIIITGATTGVGGCQPIGVNGKVRKVPLNTEVQVNAAELAVLESSNVRFTTVTPLPATKAGGGSVGSSESPEIETTEVLVPGQPNQTVGGAAAPVGETA